MGRKKAAVSPPPLLAPVYRTRLDGTCAGVSQSFCLRSPFSCLIFHLPHSLLFTHAYNAEGGSCVSLFPRDAEGKRERSPSTCIPCLLFPSRGFRRGRIERHGGRERREERRRLPPIRFVLFLFTARNCTQVRTHFQFLGESQS